MVIREAKKADAEYISLLARITFDETFGHLFKDRKVLLEYFNTTFSVQKIRESIQKENNVFWLAFMDDLPVGYSKLKINSSSEFLNLDNSSQLQKIYVLKDFLSTKIGFLLQEKLLEKAKILGSKNIWLSVLRENKRAINFYKKSNFIEIGKHQFQIGEYTFNFIAMNKIL